LLTVPTTAIRCGNSYAKSELNWCLHIVVADASRQRKMDASCVAIGADGKWNEPLLGLEIFAA
jgi:hypothetical protein